jgi:hypothetical protein
MNLSGVNLPTWPRLAIAKIRYFKETTVPAQLTLENLKRSTISIGLLLALAGAVWPATAWFQSFHNDFVTKDEAAKQIAQELGHIEQKVDQNTRTLDDHVEEFRIRMALYRIENLEGRLYVLRRDNANPELVHELEQDLDHAQDYKTCLVAGRRNCQHLEPGRSR